MTRSIAVSEFMATCLAVLDVVAESAEEFVFTIDGRPVARLIPIVTVGKVLCWIGDIRQRLSPDAFTWGSVGGRGMILVDEKILDWATTRNDLVVV